MSTAGSCKVVYRTESDSPPDGRGDYTKEYRDARGRLHREEFFRGGSMVVSISYQYFEKHGIPVVVKTFHDYGEEGPRRSARNVIQTIGGVQIAYIYGSDDRLMYVNIEHPVENGEKRVLSLAGRIDSDSVSFNDGVRSGCRYLDEMLEVTRERVEGNSE